MNILFYFFSTKFSHWVFSVLFPCVCTFHLTNERKWNAIYGLWISSVWVRANRAFIHHTRNVCTIAHSFFRWFWWWSFSVEFRYKDENEWRRWKRKNVDRESAWGRCNVKAYTILQTWKFEAKTCVFLSSGLIASREKHTPEYNDNNERTK